MIDNNHFCLFNYWSERCACTGLGHCRQMVMVSINSVFFLVFLSLTVTFLSLGVVQGFKLHHSQKKMCIRLLRGLGRCLKLMLQTSVLNNFRCCRRGAEQSVTHVHTCMGVRTPLPEHFLVRAECVRCP